MKKSLIIICLLLGLSFAIAEFFQDKSIDSDTDATTNQKLFRVAVLTPVTHPSLEQIQQGFCETLTHNGIDRYQFTVYNAQGSQTLMRSELEEMSSKRYDLIFAIGTQAAKMSKEVLTKKHQTTPLVFAAVPNPEEHHLVQSESTPNGFVTGISEITDYSKQMDLLAHLKPDLKSVLLVYDPTNAGLDRDRIIVENKLSTMGIRLIPIEVFKTNEIKQKVSPFIHEVDVVMTLKDNTVVAGLETLVKLCHTTQTLLMASDLDSPLKGAAIGFGVKEYDFGVEAAKKARLILHDGLSPHQIPVTAVDQFKLKFNTLSMAQQGLPLDPFLHYLIENGEGI